MDDKNDKVARARRALAKTPPPEVRCWETPLTLHAPGSWGWAGPSHMSGLVDCRAFLVPYTSVSALTPGTKCYRDITYESDQRNKIVVPGTCEYRPMENPYGTCTSYMYTARYLIL